MEKTANRDVPILKDEFVVTVHDAEFRIRLSDDNKVNLNGISYTYDFKAVGSDSFSLILEKKSFTALWRRDLLAEGRYSISINGCSYEVVVEDRRSQLRKAVLIGQHHSHVAQTITAPMPGLVVRVEVQLNAEVRAGDGLIVLEAMKMENEIRSIASGLVKQIHVAPGTVVEKGDPLISMEHR